MKRVALITALVAAVVGIGVGTSYVSAQTPTSTPTKTIVQRIAERFGLNQSDVQAVFDQNRREHQAQHHTMMEERLNQLVAEGKLNESQKQAILSKIQEWANQKPSMMQNFRNMTPAQRQAERQKKQQEMKAWAESIGIDPSILGGLGHRRFGMKIGGMMR